MRSPKRTDRASDTARLLPAVASMALALIVVGASLGAIAVSSGAPLWLVTVMAALVFAGGSEFLVVGLATAGAAPLTVLLGGWLLNARHLPYGLAMGDVLDGGLGRRLVGSHLLVDEAVAFALAESEPRRRRRAYWVAGTTLYAVWAPSVLLGGLLGRGLGDPQLLGLDAALPAGLLTLVLPAVRDRPTARAVLLGCLLAVLTVPLLDEGLAVLVALLGTAAALLPVPRVRRGADVSEGESV
ncbi:4-azaleucine resistance probable transporter AzlC [Actinopolyspora mzabensis]|uniref:4-azaleucine resistance probable transporter AzlC n=1 Tax=Actinopolyspora mzabensis TaxID=995066 RepID=A0A1G9BC92_ACTMZ|nr:AzlC family ABC transporter permease [Actinopolyspora mzabensis]SDK37101.1 4-azaleucine resistance probable transporter AzlC [Actinopolyspora mzabensis]